MFQFRLEPVLRYRTWLEEKQQMLAAIKLKERQDAVEREKMLRDRRRAYLDSLTKEMDRDEMRMNMISFYQSYIFHIEREHAAQTQRVAAANRALVEEQKKLALARRDREVMTRAKEKAKAAWQEEEDRKDRLFLDELSGIKFVREKQGLDPFAV